MQKTAFLAVAAAIAISLLLTGCAYKQRAQETTNLENQGGETGTAEGRQQSQEPNAAIPAQKTGMENKQPAKIFHQGDLLIQNGTYLINNSILLLNGSLILNGTGNLILENSELHFLQEYGSQYGFDVCNWENPCNATAVFRNSKFFTNEKRIFFEYMNGQKIRIENTSSWNENTPWHSVMGRTEIEIMGSTIGLNAVNNAKVRAEKSNLFFELILEGAHGEFTLPRGHVQNFSLSVPNDDGEFEIKALDSTIRHWGATISHDSNITFINTNMTLGMNAGNSENSTKFVNVSGLKAKTYPDFTLLFDTNRIRLINTTITSWYPQVLGNTTLEIRDSDLSELQDWGGENARLVAKNVTTSTVLTLGNSIYEISDSEIFDDVTATGNSTIRLYNTKVGGRLQEFGDGKIFMDGKRLGE